MVNSMCSHVLQPHAIMSSDGKNKFNDGNGAAECNTGVATFLKLTHVDAPCGASWNSDNV